MEIKMNDIKFNIEMGIYDCPKKLISRKETIIHPHRQFIGDYLTENKQYWSMCARCIDDNGYLIPNCELDQMYKTKLITSYNQFHGVDKRIHLYEANLKSKIGGNWYCGDFRTEMIKSYNKGTFNPGIVNVDALFMPNRGVVEFGNMLHFLSEIKNDKLLLIGNFIIRQRKICHNPNDIFEDLKSIINIPNFKWKSNYKVYIYNGSGNCKGTWMGSIFFYYNN